MYQTFPRKAEELRTESSHLLKKNCPLPKPKITLEEQKEIRELKEDQSQVVLTADKGVAMNVMDREGYRDKAHLLLADTNTYKPNTKDPTNKLKNKLSLTLMDIRDQRGLNDHIYRKVYLTSAVAPKFSGLPKYINLAPLRGIVSSRGPSYNGVTSIICPLVGQSPNCLKNTHHFVQQIKEQNLEPGETMTSYDVEALFTSVPMDPSLNIVKQKLQQDPLLSQTTYMSIPQIITHLEFCLKTHTSSLKVNITNRSMVLPWVPPLALLLPTCLWKSSKSRPLALSQQPPVYG